MSKGSLMLFDASRSSVPFSYDLINSPVTVDVKFPNVAADEYLAILGNASAESRLTFRSPGTRKFKTELTAKKGLHIINPKAFTEATIGTSAGFMIPEPLADYLNNLRTSKPNSPVYGSAWLRCTRTGRLYYTHYLGANANNNFFNVTGGASNTRGNLGATVTGAGAEFKAVGEINAQGAGTYITGNSGQSSTVSTLVIDIQGGPVTWPVDVPSFILYQYYLEDMGASGRTYAQIKAIDDQLFAEAFAPGGKFHGDTWSSPATLVP
jgi:hypothetical protein